MENYGHKTATTINGVVINIGHSASGANDQKIVHSASTKKVRRDPSFRVAPPTSFNGHGRAPSPTLSSASGSPFPQGNGPLPINSVPVESVRARALQVSL